jgi:4-carboxymuconolactone decarboxylase
MPVVGADTHQTLSGISSGKPDVLDEVIGLRARSFAASGLDARTFSLVQIASLIAMSAPTASYSFQVASAIEDGVTAEEIVGVLRGVALQVGGPRVVAAASEISAALGVAVE